MCSLIWVLPIEYSLYKKAILRIFLYMFICKVTIIKVNFHFYNQCSQAKIHLIPERVIFPQNVGIAI